MLDDGHMDDTKGREGHGGKGGAVTSGRQSSMPRYAQVTFTSMHPCTASTMDGMDASTKA
jgi:hypothetical protein